MHQIPEGLPNIRSTEIGTNVVSEELSEVIPDSRNRTMTEKGREYQISVKESQVIPIDRELLTKFNTFNVLLSECNDIHTISIELEKLSHASTDLAKHYNIWVELVHEETEKDRIISLKNKFINNWHYTRNLAESKLKCLQEDSRSSFSQGSQRSKSSRRSSSSASSRKTLLDCKAQRAALEQRLKYMDEIQKREAELARLKVQQELSALTAKEVIYQEEVNDEELPELSFGPSIMDRFLENQPTVSVVPTPSMQFAPHPVTSLEITQPAALSTTPSTSGATSQTTTKPAAVPNSAFPPPVLPSMTPSVSDATSLPIQSATLHETSSASGVTSLPIQPAVPYTSLSTYTANSFYRMQPASSNTLMNTPASSQQQVTSTHPTWATNSSPSSWLHPTTLVYTPFSDSIHSSMPQRPAPATTIWPTSTSLASPYQSLTQPTPYFPGSVCQPRQAPPLAPPSLSTDERIAVALSTITQLQRLPTTKPDIFTGENEDKKKFFIWETAFDALVGNVPVSPSQKLHLLYQHLDGRAKKVVEQLQFMINDPSKSYTEARKKLRDRFGHPELIGTEFEQKLANWPTIGNNDPKGMRDFSDFLEQVQIAAEHVPNLRIFEFPSKLQLLVKKLPNWFVNKWSNKVQKLQQELGRSAFPSFSDFVKEVSFHAERMNIPQTQIISDNKADDKVRLTHPNRRRGKGSSIVTLASSTNQPVSKENPVSIPAPKTSTTSEVFCFYHKKSSHSMADCEQFLKLSFEERKDFLKKNRLCFNCINSDKHVAKECPKSKPDCKLCNKKHATAVHDPSKNTSKPVTSRPEDTTSACTQVCGKHQARSSAKIVLLHVFHHDNPTLRIPTYAMLDDQSSDTFITSELLEQLGTKGEEISLEVNTIVGVNSVRTLKINGLRIQDIEGEHPSVKVPYAFSQDKIPGNHADIATPDSVKCWPHLTAIARHIRYYPDIKIGLLIGRNIPTAFQPTQIIYGSENQPWAERYRFGWTVMGPLCLDEGKGQCRATVNRIHTQENAQDSVFISDNRSKDVTSPKAIKEMMQLDYSEVHYDRTQSTGYTDSIEDKRFNRILEQEIKKNASGNWEMPLPFKSDNVKLPDNRRQCVKRLLSLKQKLLKNSSTRFKYSEFMQKMFDKKHATRVPEEQLLTEPGKVWYLPHFDVYHPRKPNQIRVVFDCSAVFENDSLNKHLLQGPDWMNALVGVLCRFRKENIAVTCDIEQMFHSFHVAPHHRDYLRFLWFEDNNLFNPIVEYRMNVHLFGAVSSPAVANFGLRKTAQSGVGKFSQEAADFLQQDFYVDDGLKSFATPDKAMQVIKNSQAMCADANLRLHKFASNSKEVLKSLPTEDRASDLKNLDLRHDLLPIQRSLGTFWCIQSDTLGFRIELKDKPFTRRGILSTVSSVYDPLGIVAPVILTGKQILQDLCRTNADWDDPLPDHIYHEWEKWRMQLPLLEDCKVDRCYKPADFGEAKSIQIHSFSDASDVGIGQVSYLRLENETGQVHVSFLMAKSRVAPLKQISIPRLELTAAVISVNVSSMLVKELAYDNPLEIFYTDSTVVLGYIGNDAGRFQVYVGNRVQHIRDRSDPIQWHHVISKENPADDASRGLSVQELLSNCRWFKGPDFLWQQDVKTTNTFPSSDLNPEDHEIRKTTLSVVLSTKTKNPKTIFRKVLEAERFNHCSSLKRLKGSIVVIQRMIERKRSNKQFNWRPTSGPFTVKELNIAENVILRSVQLQNFRAEIQTLQGLDGNNNMYTDCKNARTRNCSLKHVSSLFKLDPFLDEDGLLRVGGRLHKSVMSYEVRHPIILPRKSHITTLFIREYHEVQCHQGYGITHNFLRQSGFWIINGRSTVSHYIAQCVTCRKLRGPSQIQKMSNLPEERLTPSAPFTYSGMDVFGPFHIKERRTVLKRWGLIFTCLASRAIHLEVVNKMETDSFINALRRFICRRGKIQKLRSDQGSNFVGAKNELATCIKELNNDQIKNFLSQNGCDWIEFDMNVPAASHMGGAWERLIRTVRSVLSGLLLDHGDQLDDEGLQTVMIEAENIINSRPLRPENLSESGVPEPITPNHLLTLKKKCSNMSPW